jgi:hypothetical protein
VFVTNDVGIGVCLCLVNLYFWFTTVSTLVAAVEVYYDARGRGQQRMILLKLLPPMFTAHVRHNVTSYCCNTTNKI